MKNVLGMDENVVNNNTVMQFQRLWLEIALGLVIGVSTNYTPYHLYNFLGYSDFPLHLIYVSFGALIISFIAVSRSSGSEMATAMMIAFLSVYCGTIIGVIIGISIDTTSHNLWPFEIILNLIYIVPTMVGAGIAYVFGLLKK